MKKKIINWCLKKVQENISYSNEELEILEYGLVSIYLLITKLVIIFALCFILGILKEAVIFMIFYNIIRLPSFGFHAPKSWICLVMSSIIFICIPFLIKFINLLEIVQISLTFILYDINILREQKLLRKTLSFP